MGGREAFLRYARPKYDIAVDIPGRARVLDVILEVLTYRLVRSFLRRSVGSSERIARLEKKYTLIESIPVGSWSKRPMVSLVSSLSTSPGAMRRASRREFGTGFPTSHGHRSIHLVRIAQETSFLIARDFPAAFFCAIHDVIAEKDKCIASIERSFRFGRTLCSECASLCDGLSVDMW